MPAARRNPLPELLEAFRAFPATRRNPRTLEYVLLREENDSLEDARRLARLAGRTEAKINLIPFNTVPPLPYRPSPEKRVQGFLAILAAGFSPIPYKIFTITAGVLSMALMPFVLASFVGRGARFYLVALLMAWGGEAMERKLHRWVDWLGWLTVAVVVIIVLAYRF